MNKNIISNGIDRRSFLKTSAKFASSAMILSLGGSKRNKKHRAQG